MIKWIWWDFDGTIYKVPLEYEQEEDKIKLKAFSEITGKPKNAETFEEYKTLHRHHGSNSMVFYAHGKERDFWRKSVQHLDVSSYLKFDQRTKDAFKEFAKIPVKHGIYTNNSLPEVKKILKVMGVDFNLFKHFITGDKGLLPKPDLQGFRKILELTKAPAGEILFVGNEIKKDILPAKSLGMQTCLVWTDEKPLEADYAFPHVADVVKIFKD